MKEFTAAVLGGFTIGQFLGLFFWALIGAYILMQINATTRDVISPRTPVPFLWKFWILDNARRILFNVVLISVTIRFSQEITAKPINEFWALVIGLSSDGLAWLINHFKIGKLSGTKSQTNEPPDFRAIIAEELKKKEGKQ